MYPTLKIIYPWLGFLLAILCLCTARHIKSAYFLISGIALLIPQSLYSAHYWRIVWLPFEVFRFILAIGLCRSIFRMGKIWDEEREFVIGMGISVGVMLVFASLLWIPQDHFDEAITIRQYAYMVLTATTLCWWIWLNWIRPVELPFIVSCWCCWLVFAVLLASGGRGGILWTVTPWKGGAFAWYLVGDIGRIGQCLVASALLVSLHPRQATA